MTPLAFPAEVRGKLMQSSILYGVNNQPLKSRPQQQPAMDSKASPDLTLSPGQSRRLGPKTRPSRVEAELISASEHHCHQNDGEVHQMGSTPKAQFSSASGPWKGRAQISTCLREIDKVGGNEQSQMLI